MRDFRSSLKPHLLKIVSRGVVMYMDSALQYMATDKELKKLGQSEHPVLRASAFREMLRRDTSFHFEIVMNNLDDSAVVATDGGEFGIHYHTVTDDILMNAEWVNKVQNDKTVHEVITKYNQLKSAYRVLWQLDPDEKYYSFIKQMALLNDLYEDALGSPDFEDIEYAIYALARYRKKEDIELIRDLLMENKWRIGRLSFQLMSDFPDTSYLRIYESIYPVTFYRRICGEQNTNSALNFLHSIATYKNERSAEILLSILNRKPLLNCSKDTNSIKTALVSAVLSNKSDAYAGLIRENGDIIKEYEPYRGSVPDYPPKNYDGKSKSGRIRWW